MLKKLRSYLKLVDVVLEVADARLPVTSRYPELESLLGSRDRILVLTRADLADPRETERWLEEFRSRGLEAVAVNARTGEGMRSLFQRLAVLFQKKRKKFLEKGLRPRPARLMVMGIPNVGKSSLLNRLLGRATARVGDRPGITRGPQWIRLGGDLQLLDTPGVLWSTWREKETALRLGAIGCIPEGSLPLEEIAGWIGEFLVQRDPESLMIYYGLSPEELKNDLLKNIGRRRGFLLPGGEIDQERAAVTLVRDFRAGRLGRFTLEAPR
ncbi:MAG TPA: ribosome biogenesis GTPase YlqF [Moorella mulderi]|nr:ribosome biogenesis GTPase YlqF [Moorella mulderi]